MYDINTIIALNDKAINPLYKYNGGITLEIDTLLPITQSTGFCVAITDNRITDTSQITPMIEKLQELSKLINCKTYIGYWLDTDTNIYCLDLSMIIDQELHAKIIANQYNQKAIFNLSNGQSVYLS